MRGKELAGARGADAVGVPARAHGNCLPRVPPDILDRPARTRLAPLLARALIISARLASGRSGAASSLVRVIVREHSAFFVCFVCFPHIVRSHVTRRFLTRAGSLAWRSFDGSERRLGKPWPRFCKNGVWSFVFSWFPITIEKPRAITLDAAQTHIFAVHPHGCLALHRVGSEKWTEHSTKYREKDGVFELVSSARLIKMMTNEHTYITH